MDGQTHDNKQDFLSSQLKLTLHSYFLIEYQIKQNVQKSAGRLRNGAIAWKRPA